MAQTPSPLEIITNLMTLQYLPQVIRTGVQLGIFDAIGKRPITAGELASQIGLQAGPLERFLRILVTAGLLQSDAEGCLRLTLNSAYLQSDIPGSLKGWVLFNGGKFFDSWRGLPEALQKGGTAFHHVHGHEYYERDMESEGGMASAMEASRGFILPLVESLQLAPGEVLVDVGGGAGEVLTQILLKNPESTGILLERPEVIAQAAQGLEKAGVAARCQMVAGSALESVPSGGSTYLLSRVLFNWDDEHAGMILKRCRQAMGPNSRLIVFEGILPSPPSLHGCLWDMMLWVNLGGQLRTVEALQALALRAGLVPKRVQPVYREFQLLEFTPV